MSNINNNCYGQIPALDVYTKPEIDAFLREKANLTSDNKLVETEVPDLAITNVFSGEVSYRDSLVNDGTIETGDIFIDTTNNITYMYTGANWIIIENAGFATINDVNISQSTTFSSNHIDTNYFKKNDLVNQHSTDSTKGYNVIYLNTELDNKLNKAVLNGSSSGTSLFSLAGNQLTIKKITGTGITENNGLITINQRASEIDDVNISTSKSFSSDKTETIYLKITNLINSGGSNSTQSTYTANRINELINDQVVGVMNETNSGIALHNDISNDNKIILKSITGTGVSENNGLITVSQANQIDNSNATLTTAYSSQTSDSRYILVANKTDQTSTDTNKIYNVVYLNTQLSNKLSKNVVDNNDTTASPIFSLSGDVLSLKRIKGTAVSEASNTFTINKLTTPEVRGMVISDINGTAHSDRTFSSIYLNNNFFLQTNLVNTHSTSTSQTYNSSYINTQLSNRLSTSVSNKSSATGHQIFEVDGQNLKLWKLNAGTNVNIVDSTPNAGVLTISSTDSVPTSGSVVGTNIQVNNSNGTSFNIDVSSLQSDIHLSSGSIIGSSLRLYYSTYNATSAPNDYFDVDITSLQNSGGSGSTSGSAIYAYSITSANKTQLNYSGLNLTSDSTDYYNYTFAQAVSNANYGISCQHEGLSTDTDTNSYIENKTVNGFQLFFAVGDNSTVTDAPIIRCNHSVQIYGLGAGGSGANTYVNSGSIVGNNIRLVLSDNSQVDVDITSLQSANTTVVSNHTDVCSISNNNQLNFPNLQLSRSNNNTLVGKNAMIYSSASDCIMVGNNVGWNSSGGAGPTQSSVFIGNSAGQQAFGSDHSILIGQNACYDRRQPNTIAIGTDAGRAAAHNALTEGDSHNTYIGTEAGRSHSGSSRCIFLGPKVGMNDTSGVDGQLRIGADSWKQLIYGVMNSAHSNSEFWVNADTVCLGSSLPSNQPSEARQIWRTSTGHLAQGAVSSISNGQKGEPGVGTKGEPGVGTKGEPGQSITGQKGETGVGLKGEPGVGIKGEPGVGLKGEPGVATNGLNGDKGEPGVGLKGEPGLKGQPGQKGETGNKGDIGVGVKGSKGEIGAGIKGSKGEDGQSADKGDKGNVGDKGQKGIPGTTGNVYWQGGKGDKGEPGNSSNQLQSNFTETNTASVQFITNKPTIRTDNNLCLVGRTNNQASYGVEIGNNNRALISGVCNVSDTTSRINLNAKQIFAPDITHITQSTTATNQIWRHYGSGVLVQNGFTPSGLFPPSGNSKYFITIDPNNNNVIWRDSLIFDSNRKISFDTANIAVKLINKNADLENEDVGKIDFHGENQNLYGSISTTIKSSTNNSRKSYMRFNVCNGTGNNVNEIFRIGQGVFSGDSDCTAEFYNGRVKVNSIKYSDGYFQERSVRTPTSAQNNYILRANNGTWDWSQENTGSSNTSEIDDNTISSTKTWSSSEIHHNVVKGSVQDVNISNRTITFTRYNDNDITKTLFTPTIWSNVAIGGIYLRDDLLNILSTTNIYPSFANNAGKVLTNNGSSVSWSTPLSNTMINSADTNLITITNNDTVGINTNHINIRPVRLGQYIGQSSRTDSVLIGEYCGHNIINNEPFTLIGGYSGYKTNTSTYKLRGFSVGIGTYSLFETGGQTAGDQNVAIGDLSLSYNEGDFVSRNTAVGFEAMRGMEAGDKYMNTALGWRAGKGAGSHDDCVYIGPTQGSTNSSANGHESRLMIGNQYHTLLDGKMENNNPKFKINAGHIEMDVSNMPTGYNGAFPNRVYLDNGLLRVGVKKNDTIYAYSITQANGTQLNSSGMSCTMTTTIGTNPVTTTTYTYTFPVATPSNDYGISVQQENASVDVNSYIISKTGTGFQLEFGNTTRYLIAHSVMIYGI